jgi:hypothetical protein
MIDRSNWSTGNLMWIAGLLEGEGSFIVDQERNRDPINIRLRVSCAMTDEDVIRKLANLAGFGNVTGPTYQRLSPREISTGYCLDSSKRKPRWRWVSQNQIDVYDLEIAILPYMGERRKKDILHTHELRRDFERTHPTGRNLIRVFPETGSEVSTDTESISIRL